MKTILGLALAVVTAIAAPAATPPAPTSALTLERLFQSPGLAGPAPRLLKLSPDGKLATLLKNRADDRDRYDLWAIDTTTGASRMLVDSEKVGSGAALSEEEKMRRERLRIGGLKGITAYDWAPDGKSLLVPLDGDLYLATLDGKARRLTNTPETEIEAKVSESGRYVSFVRNQNLFVIDLTTGREHALTTDGKDALSWGTAEFVAQEELNRFSGTWWGPGDARVAVQRTDESKVKLVNRAAIGANETHVVEQRYPAAGTANAVVQLWLMDADGSHRVQADLGVDTDIYLARVTWAKDGKAVYVQRLSRDQKKLDMLKVDPATGRSTLLFSETSKTWVDLNDDFRALSDGSLIWSSTRTGTKHLYRWVAGTWIPLTHGPWTLETDGQSFNAGLIGVDQTHHRLFFTANKDDVLESQVYTIDYLKPGEPQRLTERGYWNDAQMDGSGQRLIVRRSSPTQPPQYYLADAAGQRLTWISENAVVQAHPYFPYLAGHRETVFGTLKAADGSILHWKMITPKMEPGRKYPVFTEHYGGPHSQTVQRAWASPMGQYLVSQGWIYFEIDNRGSANRGRAFEDQIYHAMGTVEVEDQVAAAKWLKTLDYVDPARIVTYGWSYGGYMTLKMLEAAPGVFAAGIAGAPVTKWELYDTAYTERYLGDPTKLPKVYEASNALADAIKISDPLLVIHGMADDNVVFENSTMLFARMQEAKVPFEMMVYPGKTHGVSGEGAQTHVWRTILDFLDRRLSSPKSH
ncbi:DPP IV N-terminal domain-containing protein [Sphingomonas sp. BIUV-7]|uniref:DPP IV N-terminal domain-containing protein n=1 Tax=Sphingomonas natans TaxID=3063330 RepID=A0ABT8YBQ1_9SPHN|nr:DPP IV N-terminal domain-containing protein [Sphingomonas sp. BIUV-7]MDO6415773.1 DPP IV N-terminal domain-containing protein [Sphingomonas sp. BIUV-7]